MQVSLSCKGINPSYSIQIDTRVQFICTVKELLAIFADMPVIIASLKSLWNFLVSRASALVFVKGTSSQQTHLES
jgi:hypothetical protein